MIRELIAISNFCFNISLEFCVVFFAEDDFQDVRITLGGDQLARVCFDSAKTLRAGTYTATV